MSSELLFSTFHFQFSTFDFQFFKILFSKHEVRLARGGCSGGRGEGKAGVGQVAAAHVQGAGVVVVADVGGVHRATGLRAGLAGLTCCR